MDAACFGSDQFFVNPMSSLSRDLSSERLLREDHGGGAAQTWPKAS